MAGDAHDGSKDSARLEGAETRNSSYDGDAFHDIESHDDDVRIYCARIGWR